MTEQPERITAGGDLTIKRRDELRQKDAEIERLRALDDQRETEHVALAGEIARLREDQSLLREIVAERQEEIAHLRAQRDRLLAALKTYVAVASNKPTLPGVDAYKIARATIAAVEGKP